MFGKYAARGLLCCLVMLFLIVASGAAEADSGAAPQKVRCPVCGMFVAMFKDWNVVIEFKDSTKAIFDGPKDMFKYYLEVEKYNPSKNRGEIAAITVKDFYARTNADAFKAFYVIWSDTYGPMGHEPVPFAKEEDAKKFLKDHKGKAIVRFADVDLKLITSLDNP